MDKMSRATTLLRLLGGQGSDKPQKAAPDVKRSSKFFAFHPSLTANGFGKKSKQPSEAARYARNRGLRVWFLLPTRCQKLPILEAFHAFSCILVHFGAYREVAPRACIHADMRVLQSGDPNGIRTRVTAVKGRCPRPLDDRVAKKAGEDLLNGAVEQGDSYRRRLSTKA
jgi:hypothetical protein